MTTGRLTFPPAPERRPRAALRVLRVLMHWGLPLLTGFLLGAWSRTERSDAALTAFRAGVQAATENGCRRSLQVPLGDRT